MLLDLANSAFAMIKSIRIPDVLDMAIIALMILALLTWFKTRASRFVLIGIILLGGVYMAARFFQLYLTTIVLQGFFAISLFVLVVIFQEASARLFRKIWLCSGISGRKITPLSDLEKMAGIIAQTASNLAKKRIGALIVLQGSDPLERHINGGIIVDGLVSEPLPGKPSLIPTPSVTMALVIISAHALKCSGAICLFLWTQQNTRT